MDRWLRWMLRSMVAGTLVLGLLPRSESQQSPTTPVSSPNVTSAVEGMQKSGKYPGKPGEKAPSGAETKPAHRVTAPEVKSTVQSVRATSGAASARASGKAAFEPSASHPIQWQDVPDEGVTMEPPPGSAPTAVTELLDGIAEATGWNVVSSKAIEEQKIRVWAKKVTPNQLLKIMRFYGIYYEFDPEVNLLSVMTIEEHMKAKYGTISKGEFRIQNAEVLDMESVLRSLMSENGKMVVDPRSGQIIVWDTPDNLKEMRETIARLDKPLEQQALKLKYINADSVLKSVENMLSEVGLAHADPKSNTIIVNDLPSRQKQIAEMIEVMDQRLETRTWTLNYIEPDVVVERLGNLVPEEMGPVSFDGDTHQISVTAIPERLEEIEKMIKAWDAKPRQVQIEAYLVSASTAVARNLGVNWRYFDERSGSPFALESGSSRPDYATPPEEGQRLTIGTLPFQVPLLNFWTGDAVQDIEGNLVPKPEFKGTHISTVLDYLDRKGDVKILSRPRVTVLDGAEATFKNTEDRPYQQGGYSEYGNPSTVNPNYNRVIPLQVSFITVGTILKVTPRISEEGNIVMDVSAEDSTAENATVTVGDQQSTIPQKRESKAETMVMVHDTQTLVIGGLRSSGIQDNVDRVPILGDVPLLGRLFRTTAKDHQEREFLIFITPTIADEFTQQEAERLAGFEDNVTKTLRHSKKPLVGRISDKLSKGENEIRVSIGQSGDVHSNGKPVTLDELRARLDGVKSPEFTTVVIRRHSEAPRNVSTEIAEAAMERGLRVEYDEGPEPFVPVDRPEDQQQAEPGR